MTHQRLAAVPDALSASRPSRYNTAFCGFPSPSHPSPPRWARLPIALVLSVLAIGCDGNPGVIQGPQEVKDLTGSVSGRLCAPTGDGWLENAHVYVHVLSESGTMLGIRETWTDRDGFFVLNKVPEGDDVVLYVAQGTYQTTLEVAVRTGELTTLSDPTCQDPSSITSLVVLGEYDSFSTMLEAAGLTGYSQVDGTQLEPFKSLLSDLNALLGFDLLCINGGVVEQGIVEDPALMDNLATYVEEGGTLFVTDWAYDLVERSFPSALTFLGDDTVADSAQQGVAMSLDAAQVVDQSLAGWLDASTIQVHYDLAYWPVVVGAASAVVVHLSGDIEHYSEDGEVLELPGSALLLSFSAGDGTVIFSTFRQGANLDEDMAAVLQYMLYKL